MPPTRQSLLVKPSKTSTPAVRRSALDALVQPLSGSPAHISQLQRQYGNRAVQQLLQRAQAEERQSPPGPEGGPVDAALQSRINSARGGGPPLDQKISSQMGRALGADFSRVTVHADAQSDALNRSLGAKAFTFGSDVFFSQGAYSPGTPSGRQLLAHELTHTLQQGAAPLQRQAMIQRVLPMKSQGTAASRTEGAANVIQEAVRATLDRRDEVEILSDMAHLALSINNREAALRAGEQLAGHQHRVDVEKQQLALLQTAADKIRDDKRAAAAEAEARKAEAKSKRKGAKDAARQAEEQQAAEAQEQAQAARDKKKADQKAKYEADKLAKEAKAKDDADKLAKAKAEKDAKTKGETTDTGAPTDKGTSTTETETQKKATAEGYRAQLAAGTVAVGSILAMVVYIAASAY